MDSMELREAYTKLAHQMRELVEASEREDREFSSEEQSKFNEKREQLEKLESRIANAEAVETASNIYQSDEDREADDREYFERKRKELVPSEYKELTNQDMVEGMRGWMLGPGYASPEQQQLADRCGFNVHLPEIHIGGELRAQSVGTTTAGGFTVADEMMAALSKTLVRFGGVREACRVITTSTGADWPWPTVNDSANTGGILAENTSDGETDVTVGQIVFNAYKSTSDVVRVSFELLQDSSFSWDALLGELLGERIGRGENALLTTGTGTGQHNGIVTAATDSTVTTASNTAYTWSEILQLVHSVDPDYRTNAAFMCNDTTLRILREISDSQSRPLWNADLSAGAPGSFAGHRIVVNQSMSSGSAAKALLFGDMSQYVVRDVRGITLRRSDERYFEDFQSAYVAYIRSDGDCIQTSAIKYLTNAT
jgi:HK97 family phage major capsid protein